MKRKKCDLRSDVTFNNLMSQYKIIRKNCKNKRKIYNFQKNLNTNIYEIGEKLINETYEFSPFNIFLIRENKYRIVMSECISDKLVSHFVTNYCLKKTIEKTLLPENVATRVGFGSSEAYRLFDKHIRSLGCKDEIFALKIDIKKYFYSISHLKLKELLMRDIKDPFALRLIFKMIDLTDEDYVNKKIIELINKEKTRVLNLNISDKEKKDLVKELSNVPYYYKEYGLSIGSVVNQLLSVYFINGIIRYLKEDLKCRCVISYMDDCLVLSKDKKILVDVFNKVTKKKNDYDLELNPKSRIYSLKNNVTFLGKTYYIKNNKLYQKTKNVTFKKVMKKLNVLRKKDYLLYYKSKMSYLGIIDKKLLISVYDEYVYLKNKYDLFIVLECKNKTYFNKDHPNYLLYLNRKKYKKYTLVRFMKKVGLNYGYISSGKCELNIVI